MIKANLADNETFVISNYGTKDLIEQAKFLQLYIGQAQMDVIPNLY